MTIRIVKLGFEIDTEVLKRAKQEAHGLGLDLLTVADAAEKMEKATKGAGASVKQATDAIKEENAAVENSLSKWDRARDASGRFVKVKQEATDTIKDHTDALKKDTDALGKVPKAQEDAGKGAAAHSAALEILLARLAAFGALTPGAIQNLVGMAQAGHGVAGSFHGTHGILNGVGMAAGRMGTFAAGLSTTAAAALGLGTGVAALAGGYLALANASYRAEEAQKLLEARLRNVFGSATAAQSVLRDIQGLAADNGMGMDITADAFLRMARNNESMGLDRQQLIDLTGTVQRLGAISGATQGEIAGGMMQFSQAIAAGRLSGDELRAIMENLPELAKQIAQGLGVSVGQLRAMGAEGQLTADKIVGALLSRMDEVNEEFDRLPDTTERAMARTENEWNRMLAAMGESLRASDVFVWWENQKGSVFGAVADALSGGSDADQLRATERAAAVAMRPGEGGRAVAMGLVPPSAVPATKDLSPEMQMELENARRTAAYLALGARGPEQVIADNRFKSGLVRADPIISELDKPAAQIKEINAQIEMLEGAWDSYQQALSEGRGEIFTEEQVRRLERSQGLLEALRFRLGQIADPLRAYRAETDRMTAGANDPMAAEVFGLRNSAAGQGVLYSESLAREAVEERRVATTEKSVTAISRQADQQMILAQNVRAGSKAQREAEIAAEAYNYQIETFGENLGPDAIQAMDAYEGALRRLKEAQALVTAEQRLMNAEVEAAVLAAKQAGIEAGATAGELAAIERRARLDAELARVGPSTGGAGGAASGGSAGASLGGAAANAAPANLQALFEAASAATGIPVELLAAVAKVESGFNPSAVSPTGARGIMQVLPSTARDPGYGVQGISPEALFDPAQNIMFGAEYLAGRARALGVTDFGDMGQMSRALRAYNGPIGGGGDPAYITKVQAAMGTTIPSGSASSASATTPEGFRYMGPGAPSPEAVNTEAILLGGANAELAARQADQLALDQIMRERDRIRAGTGADPVSKGRLEDVATAQAKSAGATPEMQEAIYQAELERLTAQRAAQGAEVLRQHERTTEELQLQAELSRLPRREREIELEVARMINAELEAGRAVDAERAAELRGAVTARWEAEDIAERERDRAAAVEEIWSTAADGIGNALRTSLRQAAKTGKVEVEEIVSDLLIDVADSILKAFVTDPLTDSLTNALSNWGAGLGGGGSTPPSQGAHGLTLMAHGGLINRPTLFPMPSSPTRMALGGENGPEAIMPLQRDANGRLGVSGGGGGMTLVINDYRSGDAAPVETEERRGPDGRRMMQVTLRDEVRRQFRSGEHDGVMRDNFGASRRLTRR